MYSFYRPGLRAMPETVRLAAIDEMLRARPEVEVRLTRERQRLAELRSYLGPDSGYVAGPGNADLCEFFCQRYRELLRSGGRLGVVSPAACSLPRDLQPFVCGSSTQRRRAGSTSSSIVAGGHSTPSRDIPSRYSPPSDGRRRQVMLLRSQGLRARWGSPCSVWRLGLRLKRSALGPELEIPLLRSQHAADLLGKLRSGTPFPYGCGRWRCFAVQGDFNETADRHLWEKVITGRPLWKGESFDQFDPRGAGERFCKPAKMPLTRPARRAQERSRSWLRAFRWRSGVRGRANFPPRSRGVSRR